MQAPQVLLLGNSAGSGGALYSVVDAHAGRQIAQGEVDMPVSQVRAACLRFLMTKKSAVIVAWVAIVWCNWQGHGPCPNAAACCVMLGCCVAAGGLLAR